MQDPSPQARTADLAGLLAFLSWVQDNAAVLGRRPATVAVYRSAWHVANKRLHLPAVTPVDDLDLELLAQQMISAGPANAKGSARDYQERLAICRRWHQRWRAGQPDWWQAAGNTPAAPQTPTLIHRFPLRPGLSIAVEVPADLRTSEADLLHTWLRNLTID
ncbi:hypothetical protein ACN27G_29215 [Plantactinospora sp. WMMB334]|uniref:hypothetical protein n=1 Tax=Plantactinospora sp. WMMB334 TaxID=3404119 RepID=UPI003B966462